MSEYTVIHTQHVVVDDVQVEQVPGLPYRSVTVTVHGGLAGGGAPFTASLRFAEPQLQKLLPTLQDDLHTEAVQVTVPVQEVRKGDQLWDGDGLVWTVATPPVYWESENFCRFEVENHPDGTRYETHWDTPHNITVRRP